MKSTNAYIVTTGVVFALVVLAHLLRVMQEGIQLAKQPSFLLPTAVATALATWAWSVARRRSGSRGEQPPNDR